MEFPVLTICGQGKPVAMLLSEGQMSDYKGARMLLPSLPKAKTLVADKAKAQDREHVRAAQGLAQDRYAL